MCIGTACPRLNSVCAIMHLQSWISMWICNTRRNHYRETRESTRGFRRRDWAHFSQVTWFWPTPMMSSVCVQLKLLTVFFSPSLRVDVKERVKSQATCWGTYLMLHLHWPTMWPVCVPKDHCTIPVANNLCPRGSLWQYKKTKTALIFHTSDCRRITRNTKCIK